MDAWLTYMNHNCIQKTYGNEDGMTKDLVPKRVFISEPTPTGFFLGVFFLIFLSLAILAIYGCTDKPVITDVKVIKVELPVITPCQRLSIPECKPINNGELYECTLTIQKNLNLCADQIDALTTWQKESEL